MLGGPRQVDRRDAAATWRRTGAAFARRVHSQALSPIGALGSRVSGRTDSPRPGAYQAAVLLRAGMRVTWMTENALLLLPALRRARDLIDRDYAEPLDLDAMAGEASYSRFHFARSFTAAYGETPRTYLTRRRIERAKTLCEPRTSPSPRSAFWSASRASARSARASATSSVGRRASPATTRSRGLASHRSPDAWC